MHPPYRFAGLAAHHVCDPRNAHGLAIHRDEYRSLAFACQFFALRGEAVLTDARLREQAAAADENLPALDASAYPAARDGNERVGLSERETAIHRPSHDGLTQGVLAGPLRRGHEPQE